MPACSASDLPPELLTYIASLANTLAARQLCCTCKRFRDAASSLDLSLVLVVASGNNDLVLLNVDGQIVQRVKALPAPVRRCGGHHRTRSVIPSIGPLTASVYNWPTCVTRGPHGSLFVSQYRIPGVLQFERTVDGYKFARVAAKHSSAFKAPEGIVYAHSSLYLVSVERGVIHRLSRAGNDTSQSQSVFRVAEQSSTFEPDGEYYTMWGMTLGPDGHLYIAAHAADGGDYMQPTETNTGLILRQKLHPETGSFDGPLSRYALGNRFGKPMLNRPSDPRFCSHGFLHVSSYSKLNQGMHPKCTEDFRLLDPTPSERRVYKFATAHSNCRALRLGEHEEGAETAVRVHKNLDRDGPLWAETEYGVCVGWLDIDETLKEEDGVSRDGVGLERHSAWGISFSDRDSGVYITCHGEGSRAPVVRLPSCGCERLSVATRCSFLSMQQAFGCGAATELQPADPLKAPNCVLVAD